MVRPQTSQICSFYKSTGSVELIDAHRCVGLELVDPIVFSVPSYRGAVWVLWVPSEKLNDAWCHI
jgi:hypothetical protein